MLAKTSIKLIHRVRIAEIWKLESSSTSQPLQRLNFSRGNLDKRNRDKAITLARGVLYSIYGISARPPTAQSLHRSGTGRCFSGVAMDGHLRAGLSLTYSESRLKSSGKYFDAPEC